MKKAIKYLFFLSTQFLFGISNGQEIDSIHHIIFEDKIINITVEKIIYKSPLEDNFYLKFIIKNKSKITIGLDLENVTKQIYPNAWCYYCKRPISINEGGRILQQENKLNELIEKFKSQRLKNIARKTEMYYYRNLNEFDNEHIDFTVEDFHILLDGQIIITNGQKTIEYRLDNKDIEYRTLELTKPVLIKNLDKSELPYVYKVISERPQGN